MSLKSTIRLKYVKPADEHRSLKTKLDAVLEDLECNGCNGVGTKNDAEPGDIAMKEWICTECNGTGLCVPAPDVLVRLAKPFKEETS